MRWCTDCGAVQLWAVSCQVCGGTDRIGTLGFEDLYEAYAGPLRRFVRRLAADRGIPESLADTDGVVHDTFTVLLSGSGQPIRNPGAWLFTVARNQLGKAAAAQRRTAPGDPADHLDDGPGAWATLASPSADAEDIRAAREVMHAIAGLPDHQRIATYLRQVQGWSLAEIGAYLNCAASTAGVHISRGTRKVRLSFSANGETPPDPDGPLFDLRAVVTLLAGAPAAVAAAVAAAVLGFGWTAAVLAAGAAYAATVAAVALVRWLRAEAGTRRRQHRFNRWLRNGRALGPAGGTRQRQQPPSPHPAGLPETRETRIFSAWRIPDRTIRSIRSGAGGSTDRDRSSASSASLTSS